ncbi:hypothetical protein FUT69_10600 [Xylella taiwanensis]|uniref:Uncharacterized protein n=1 Tax=Xylella taiwanensis TaxID=1444770 RepID=Z9JGP7_9GAMM|nr:hypothetical protein [Xylella taiwanensis]AXI82584.1 hypothetical protein AB672_00620 [Xylella taiwanensis]EWS77359.1 hypothetical protein AF72_11365 [Xylella taiwanensis]MCD8455578.1 hypothetical protein [Xylella taiwanensis]MCD8457985.1 hypothetical protein [Xylella taiwanensis]MCD8460120.1 hypothetical protein [Xylella taiwanensis]
MQDRDHALETGQRFNADRSVSLARHLRVHDSGVLRTGYSEQHAVFLVNYSAVNNRYISVYIGADVTVPLNTQHHFRATGAALLFYIPWKNLTAQQCKKCADTLTDAGHISIRWKA